MAKSNTKNSRSHRVTSDGDSKNTKPKNKQKKRNFKPSRGQGHP